MRMHAVLLVLALAAAVPAPAEEKPPLDLPAYPGAESTLEINLTGEDLLPTVQALLPVLAQKFKPAEKLNPEDVAAALKDVKRIEVLQLEIGKSDVTESAVADYYVKNLPAGQWSRVFWQSKSPIGTMALYVQGGGESLYGFRVQTVRADDKPLKRITVAKTEGKIDFVKLLTILSKLLVARGE